MKRLVWPAASLLLAAAATADPSNTRQAELLNLLKHDCGSCHGLTLSGGLGPSLRPDVVANKPVDYLALTILYGRPGTPMPPWRPFLTEQEAVWLAEQIRAGVL